MEIRVFLQLFRKYELQSSICFSQNTEQSVSFFFWCEYTLNGIYYNFPTNLKSNSLYEVHLLSYSVENWTVHGSSVLLLFLNFTTMTVMLSGQPR